MQKSFFSLSLKLGFGGCVLAAAAAALMKQPMWSAGILTAACWMFLNVFFLYKLLEMGVKLDNQRHPGRMLVLAVLKFPVIYLTGYFILKTRFFPVESLLTGITLYLAAIGAARLMDSRRAACALLFFTCTFLLAGGVVASADASETHAQAVHSATVSRTEGHAGAHEAAGHDAHKGGSHAHPETINWVQLIAKSCAPSPLSDFLVKWEKAIFTGLVVLILSALSIGVSKRIQRVPGRFQTFMELVVSGLDGLVQGVIGPQGRAYTPFLGTLFLYILTSNLLGLIPLQNSIMAYLTSVLPITICVFLYVQWIGITKNGPIGYLLHLCGSPKDVFGWVMAPLMFPLHVLGEFIKPLSLTFRLYGNIMSGHLLLAVFLGMGVSMLKSLKIPAGIPIHFPFLFLEILVGVIQAFVFTLLSTIYIAMMLPHEEHGHEEGHSAGEKAHH